MPHHPILGELITSQQQKDAIHIAVAPVVAAEKLSAGQHIGLINVSTMTVSKDAILIGIVDPFLEKTVRPGDQFWMFLYPQTVTNLRHDWGHPAFSFPDVTLTKAGASENWIRAFAERMNIGHRDLMDGAKEWIASEGDQYLIRGGLLEGERVPDEFWEHYENVTGAKVKTVLHKNFFSCSC